MGGGDLNLKKSWHTGLLSNQRKVWEAEQSALAERKKIEQVRREREEERQIEELARLAEANGGPQRKQRVGWMYNGADSGTQGATEEQEAFLLGKRRVDTLLKKDDAKQLEKVEAVKVDPTKDVVAKVAMDPLLLIEKQRQEAMEKAMALEAKIQERKIRHEKEKRSRQHREHREDREHRERRDHRRSHRSRSRSPARRRRDRHSDDERDHRRRRHRSRSEDRSKSPARKRGRTYHDERETRLDEGKRNVSRDRSRSPPRHNRHSYYKEEAVRVSEHRQRHTSQSPVRREQGRHYRPERRDGSRRNQASDDEEMAARLAAMKADASNLEGDRARRLEALEKQETEEREREDRKRNKGTNFKASLYQQTENVSLENRLKGSRGLLST